MRSPSRRSGSPPVFPRLALIAVGLVNCGIPAAFAQQADPATIAGLRAELEALRAEQAERDLRILRIEAALDRMAGDPAGAISQTAPGHAPAAAAPSPPAAAFPAAAVEAPRLQVSGDLRLRAQSDHFDDTDQLSGQFRGRLAATYAINDRVTIGGRLATGDPDNPRSTDVQLSNWNDDLEVSLDMAYARIDLGNLQLYAGKFPQPFVRTDLVWDGDVNPQGAAASYRLPTGGGGAVRATGLFFPVDVGAGRSDSTMAGLQLGYDSAGRSGFGYAVSGGYYDYSLGQPAARHLRSNRVDASGAYLSDYRLLNLTALLEWQGANEAWPVRVVGDYVRNLGAIDDQDTGYELTASVGRASPGHWRLSYGYARTDVDAVLAAFSHDNISIATNYRLHTMSVDYGLTPNTSIGGIWYRFRPDNPAFTGSAVASEWIDRMRLFYLVTF